MKKVVGISLGLIAAFSMSISPALAYTIQPGDTLSEIADEKNISLHKLSKANPHIKDIDLIFPGQELKLDEKKKVEKKVEEKKEKDSPESSKTIKVEATAYTAYCDGCSGTTFTGIDLKANPNSKVIAVDPNVIPLGSKVYVEGYGEAIAGDIGSAIKGNRIDIYMQSRSDALKFGRQTIDIKILD